MSTLFKWPIFKSSKPKDIPKDIPTISFDPKFKWELKELGGSVHPEYILSRVLEPTGRWKLTFEVGRKPEMLVEVDDGECIRWVHERWLTLQAKPIEVIFNCKE